MKKKSKALIALMVTLVMVMTTACSINISMDKESPSTDTGITIEETVLYDANDVKITATGYVVDEWNDPTIKILIENNSTQNIEVVSDSVSVNGYMMSSASLYVEVAAGKKANESLCLSAYELEQAGIETIAEIQFRILLQDPDSWDIVATSDLLTLTTSAAPYEQPVDDSGDVLYDSDGIRVICKGLKQDDLWDGILVLYMENNSGKDISIYAEDVSINDFMQDMGLWSDLRDGTKRVDGMAIVGLIDLDIESIDEIKNIEFTLRIDDAQTWENIVTTDVISLNFD